jgi:hypothetical protein
LEVVVRRTAKFIRLLLATLSTLFTVILLREAVPAPAAQPPPAGGVISMAASAWVFQFGADIPVNPTQAGAGWYFDFPGDCAIDPRLGYKPCSVNYLVTAFGGAISEGKIISMNYQIDIIGAPLFNYLINPDNTCGSGSPGTCGFISSRSAIIFSGRSCTVSTRARARLNGNLELSRRMNIVRHSRRAENHYAA